MSGAATPRCFLAARRVATCTRDLEDSLRGSQSLAIRAPRHQDGRPPGWLAQRDCSASSATAIAAATRPSTWPPGTVTS